MTSSVRDAHAELRLLAEGCRANILIVGHLPSSERDDLLETIKSHCGQDVFHAQRQTPHLALPAGGDLILVLDAVCELSRHQQGQLLRWVSQHKAVIVSFASSSVYDMVCEGRFIDRLYYHLNTLCIVL
jgi:hypothetical protein